MKKYQKRIKRMLALLMPLFILLALVINIIVPDKDISFVENRSLQKFPEINKTSFVDGSFENKMSNWFGDQFVGRNGLIHLRYGVLKLMGQKKINDIYLCGKQLIEDTKLPNKTQLSRNLNAINAFTEKHSDVDTSFMLIPNAVYVQNKRLPYFSDENDQGKIMDSIYNTLDSSVYSFDARKTLKKHSEEYLYYKSDHHWTSLGAFYTYQAWQKQQGNDDVSLKDYDQYVVSNNFRGTLANGSGSFGIKDDITIFVNKNLSDYYVQEPKQKNKGSIYDSSFLKTKDQYSVFLGGNKDIQRIELNNNSKRHLLLFKDSYANSFVQFIMNDYCSITIVDPRYYRDDIEKVMQEDLITDVMYLYNTNTFVEDTSLADVLGE
ncbi:DHHW family protein [uncultured Holdemanella sp.]|uniref:DHHW family protein n=1 Tax=uncultured Holdemanella sp. TaxID=1763549 RepID=UPI00265821C3|nr:DHHW family protein [uncultured Holdemanella sp.]